MIIINRSNSKNSKFSFSDDLLYCLCATLNYQHRQPEIFFSRSKSDLGEPIIPATPVIETSFLSIYKFVIRKYNDFPLENSYICA